MGDGGILSEVLKPSEVLKVDAGGQIKTKEKFNTADLDDWWTDADYIPLDCPPNSRMDGPDCRCNSGYEPDIASGQCLKKQETQSILTGVSDETLLVAAGIGIALIGAGLLILLVTSISLWHRKKKKKV